VKGVLLVNLGSPDSPAVGDVRRYLREFLMDGRVVDIPWLARFFLVHGIILPRRPQQSAEAYRKIWTPEGSPLVASSRRLAAALRERVGVSVGLAMRYRNPSISDALEGLEAEGVTEVLLIPLFPHYAMSSYETAVERVLELARRRGGPRIEVVPPYYDHPQYIRALVATAAEHLTGDYDRLLFSFHGIPERHLRKSDPTAHHCLGRADCCAVASPAHRTCYRRQCFRTAEAFVEAAGIPGSRWSVAFQSRLGRAAWLKPYTDEELARLAAGGVKRLLVICPAFVTDCLETIEEIGLRGRELFVGAGGQDLIRIPCLNEHPAWLDALTRMVERFTLGPCARAGSVYKEKKHATIRHESGSMDGD
jgi:ferrochelatase